MVDYFEIPQSKFDANSFSMKGNKFTLLKQSLLSKTEHYFTCG